MIRGWLNKLTDPDQALCFAMNSCIEAAAVRYALDARCERYREGEPLKLFLANYVGSRNTGSGSWRSAERTAAGSSARSVGFRSPASMILSSPCSLSEAELMRLPSLYRAALSRA